MRCKHNITLSTKVGEPSSHQMIHPAIVERCGNLRFGAVALTAVCEFVSLSTSSMWFAISGAPESVSAHH